MKKIDTKYFSATYRDPQETIMFISDSLESAKRYAASHEGTLVNISEYNDFLGMAAGTSQLYTINMEDDNEN